MGNRWARLAAFAASGFAYGWATSHLPMPGHGDVTHFWIGNLCAPWLVLAFLAGRSQASWVVAALAVAATDVACVLGFYFRDFDPHARWSHDPNAPLPSAVSEVRHWLQVNDQWFAAALLAGTLYGCLGLMWRRTRSLPAGLAVAAGFIVEPALWPVHDGRYKGPWFLWAAEVLVGIAVGWRFLVSMRGTPAGSPPRRAP